MIDEAGMTDEDIYPEFEFLKAKARRDAAAEKPIMLTPEQQASWDEWVTGRPPAVAEVCRRFPGWRKFWLDPPGQVVRIYSYHEIRGGGVSMTVLVLHEDNPHVVFERTVFGITPNDLHELRTDGA